MRAGRGGLRVGVPQPIGPATRLCDLPLPGPVCVEDTDSVVHVAELMQEAGVAAVVVGGRPFGIATEHDLVRALASFGPSTPVSRVACFEPVAVSEAESLLAATRLMVDAGVRHLVVLSSAGDVRAVLPQSYASALLVDGLDHVVWEASRLRATHLEIRSRPF